jgi:hypothetical protein
MTKDKSSPVHVPFLRRVDLRDLDSFVKEEDVHLIEQELV